MTSHLETIAVYSESVIRTYGFEVRRGLALVTLTPMAAALDLEQAIANAGIPEPDLLMATGLSQPDGTLQIQLVLATGDTPISSREPQEGDPHHLRVVSPVEVIYFHGPHFGDRYGIAAAAVKELHAGKVACLAMDCTGASIHLAVPDGRGDEAVQHLRRSFSIPGDPSPGEGA